MSSSLFQPSARHWIYKNIYGCEKSNFWRYSATAAIWLQHSARKKKILPQQAPHAVLASGVRQGGEIIHRFPEQLRLHRLNATFTEMLWSLWEFTWHLPSWTKTRGQNCDEEFRLPSALGARLESITGPQSTDQQILNPAPSFPFAARWRPQ